MRLSQLSCIVVPLSVSAQAQGHAWERIGSNRAGSGSDEALRIYEEAGQNPNASDIVTFAQSFNNTPEDWKWRINISEIAVPNDLNDLGLANANFSEGLHVVHTQWQLEWPGEEDDLRSFIRSRNIDRLDFSALMARVESNLTDHFEDSDNGDCTPMLGQRCIDAIRQRAGATGTLSWSPRPLEGCEIALDDRDSSKGRAVGFSLLADDQRPNEWPRNGALVFATSGSYEPGEMASYNQSLRALHILVMQNWYSQGPVSGPPNATVVCRVVDKATGTAGLGDGSTAASWRQSMLAVISIPILATLFVML
ncbi:hypothetical protein T440DRAFT_482958 [Plenodomus tracheiphilus IPT5]|uniref:Uncharacterized protein n=1 Tax=Plenodomus tracheiphilus IPT5 TaxID=1408161 RepID=A0A6A7ARJ0_9PLEO|nr:hypothetical protein T440DRAFT_482958 [Plenodomus tracheiphilus IPT5]